MSSSFYIPDKRITNAPDPGGLGSSGDGIFSNPRKSRYSKFSDALSAASKYRQKAKDKAIIEKKVKEDDDNGTSGFKIADDAFVVEGYRDPGYTIPGQQGRSILGTVGAGLTPFFPITGQAIGAVGSLTGI
tara:strand:- start:124 stop:516 length:393 start_codon:yes stop_codon:yes gene_type:complete